MLLRSSCVLCRSFVLDRFCVSLFDAHFHSNQSELCTWNNEWDFAKAKKRITATKTQLYRSAVSKFTNYNKATHFSDQTYQTPSSTSVTSTIGNYLLVGAKSPLVGDIYNGTDFFKGILCRYDVVTFVALDEIQLVYFSVPCSATEHRLATNKSLCSYIW